MSAIFIQLPFFDKLSFRSRDVKGQSLSLVYEKDLFIHIISSGSSLQVSYFASPAACLQARTFLLAVYA
jgi:hypothetical protein